MPEQTAAAQPPVQQVEATAPTDAENPQPEGDHDADQEEVVD